MINGKWSDLNANVWLESLPDLELCNVTAVRTRYRGREALRVIEQNVMSDEPTIAIRPLG